MGPDGSAESDPRVLSWAEAVADRRPVDWDRAGAESPDLKESADAMRLVDEAVSSPSSGAEVPADPAPLAPGAAWGSFRIVSRIGGGSFGDVYRAHDPALDLDVALKVLYPRGGGGGESIDRAYEEARRLARLRHPNVLRVLGTAIHDGRVGIWTELLEGKTLEESLGALGPLSPHEVSVVGIDLCHALAAVHGAGLVHRDLKTANVMRETGGRLVLMDFGSGSALASPGSADQEAARAYGTPLTVAPELLRGEPATVASDLYALGVLLFRLVTGRYPIEAETYADLRRAHEEGKRARVVDLRPDLPGALADVIERALAPDASHRFQSAGEMERELRAVLARGPARTGSGGWIPWSAGAAILAVVLWLAVRPHPIERPSQQVAPPVTERSTEADRAAPATGATAPRVGERPAAPSRATVSDRAPLRASATLVRDAEASAGGPRPLVAGSSVAVGDLLALDLQSDDSVYVYVFDEDETGGLYVLFPLHGYDEQNPLAPGVVHRLPGRRAGERRDWSVTYDGGREEVVVVASRTPYRSLERALAPLAHADGRSEPVRLSGDPAAAGPGSPRRGIGGSAPAPGQEQGADRSPKIDALLRAAAAEPGAPRDIWTWRTWVRGVDVPGR